LHGFLRDLRAGVGLLGLQRGGAGFDGDGVGNGADVELGIGAGDLIDGYLDVLDGDRLEAGGGYFECVDAAGNTDGGITAGGVGSTRA
jgi:fermentation-respiration switch protein FrsA (DUF1100 family)